MSCKQPSSQPPSQPPSQRSNTSISSPVSQAQCERQIQRRAREVEDASHTLLARSREIDDREQDLNDRLEDIVSRENRIEEREQCLDVQVQRLQTRTADLRRQEHAVEQREASLREWEDRLEAREEYIVQQESDDEWWAVENEGSAVLADRVQRLNVNRSYRRSEPPFEYFTITRGLDVGVFKARWGKVKPLVDKIAGAIYKGYHNQATAELEFYVACDLRIVRRLEPKPDEDYPANCPRSLVASNPSAATIAAAIANTQIPEDATWYAVYQGLRTGVFPFCEFDPRAIRRWLKYRARKLATSFMKADTNPDQNPYSALLLKLSGLSKAPQRARQGWQQFMHEHMDLITPAATAAWEAKCVAGLVNNEKNNVSHRAEIARKLFNELPIKEQELYTKNAKKAKDEALAAWKQAAERALTDNRSPSQRQLCLDNIAAFMTPILQGLKDMTGYHWVLLGGGPTPRLDGEIGTVHLNAGLNLSSVPLYWRQWDEKRFDDGVTAFFKQYLETCFSNKDRSAAVMPTLDDAQFTIPHAETSTNQNSESSSSEGGSDDDSDESLDIDLPSPAKAKSKKRKSKPQPRASPSPTPAPLIGADGLSTKRKRTGSTAAAASKKLKPVQAVSRAGSGVGPPSAYELDRNEAIARNKKMLEALDIVNPLEGLIEQEPQPIPARPKPRPKKAGTNTVPRHSSCYNPSAPNDPPVNENGADSSRPQEGVVMQVYM
ncbi:hypothetical protein HWV62_44065 [Athelia sp. TMB]|nr:hypothetical protein HWV62_44065 [Athelia sp. TMB]